MWRISPSGRAPSKGRSTWPLIEFSGTPAPAMPEGTEISPIKSVWQPADAEFRLQVSTYQFHQHLTHSRKTMLRRATRNRYGCPRANRDEGCCCSHHREPQTNHSIKSKDTKMTAEVTLEQIATG